MALEETPFDSSGNVSLNKNSKPVSENSTGFCECNICLDSARDPVVTLCGHLYCWPCIYKWLHVQATSTLESDKQPKCPVCKAHISNSSLVPLYGRGNSNPNPNSDSDSPSSELESKSKHQSELVIPSRPSAPGGAILHLNQQINPHPVPFQSQSQFQPQQHIVNHSRATSGGDESFLATGSQPIFERLIDFPKLDENKLNKTNLDTFYQPPALICSSDKVRATFVLTRTNINQLKKRVLTQQPELEYISSFTVTCGYIWSCIAKARVKMGEKKGEDELEQFILTVDCRSRLDPPVPATYFGNCGAPCIATIKNTVLAGENGSVIAAKFIGEAISKMVKNKDGILKDVERWHDGFKIPARKIGVAGTPKLDFYGIDFGWGKVKKYEAVSIDYNGSVSINSCKQSTQDVEIGLCFSSVEMEAFANIFNGGLEN